MAIPCPEPKPHRSHFADNADGICGGVPRREDRERALVMVEEAFEAAVAGCSHRRPALRPCRSCAVAELLDLSVFEPVLFPEESQ